MIDEDSLIVTYESWRGEPRGAKRKSQNWDQRGDCIDCKACVQVCPTGIDIRQGLQMECIGCTACIDACDAVMTKLHRPRGLIRYDSQEAFTGGRTRWIRPRIIVYFVLLLLG